MIIGNWKMNGSRSSVAKLAEGIKAGLQSCNVPVVICPPTLFVADVAACINTGINTSEFAVAKDAAQELAEPVVNLGLELQLGAQNICEYAEGAYTGEVSGSMLYEFGCRYVLVGHSERRQHYHETDQQVANKLVAAQQAGLQPVICVGETAAQHERGETRQVVRGQLNAIIEVAGLSALASAVIAYEPIWAIGTGKVATADVAQKVLSDIRALLGALGEHTPLLYGGSVTIANAQELFEQPDIDGALVGGASLDAEQFVKICKIAGLS